MNKPSKEYPVIAWWSGGITSAVACKLVADIYGIEKCRFIFLNTRNEHPDTTRFMTDCGLWYGKHIESITNEEYESIEEVWYKFNSLNVANGAICSSELKRDVRIRFSKENKFSYQVFGFSTEKREVNRARSMKLNYPDINPIFPLLMFGLTKEDCITYVQDAGIKVPETYHLGFENNNCFNTGCVQGGIGYWQKMKREHPEKFEKMAAIEHELTERKGEPVTMLKDQANDGGYYLFLKAHPDYPEIRDISQKNGREPKQLMECNGFCGIEDLNDNSNKNLDELNLTND